MVKKWMGVALLTALVGSGAARAQYGPGPAGPRMPEPMPLGQARKMVPGPLSPHMAPPGPPHDLSLPAGIPGAFDCEPPNEPSYLYFHAGFQALMRQRLGHGVAAFRDAGDTSGLDVGGVPAIGNIRPALDLNDLEPLMAFGPKGTVGFLTPAAAFELTGFYISQFSDSIEVADPGRLNLFFFNPPLGFEGNVGLFQQADIVRATLEQHLGSAEFNLRLFDKSLTGWETLIGFRYFYLAERFSLFTDDDGLTFLDLFGRGDPNRVATYSTRVHNHILAPQLGVEYQHQLLNGLAFGMHAKAALGVDFADIKVTLNRGDGLAALGGGRSRINFSSIYDIGAYFDLYLLERFRVRAGYTTLWLVNVPEAVDQLDYNLANPMGIQDNSGNIFYHGPTLELQFLF